MTFIKKPVKIEAVKYVGGTAFDEVPQWIREAYSHSILYWSDGELFVRTLEGDHHASEGDYIIKGVKGEIYPCKPDIFEMTYEPVELT